MSDTVIDRPTSTELRERCVEAGDKLRDLRSRNDADRGDTYTEELRTQTRIVAALDAEFDNARAVEAHEIEQAAWDAAVRSSRDNEGRGPSAAMTDLSRQVPRTIGEMAVEDEGYRAWVDGGHKGPMPTIELRGSLHSEYRTLIDSTDTGAGNAGLLLPLGQPIPPVPRQIRMFLRDLIPSTPTTLASVPYVRELNPATNETAASSVAEGVAKPEVTMDFEDADAPIRKIAAWVPVTEEILADAPILRAYIENRLRYMVQFREQDEFLNGNGVAPDLTGIRVVSGTQTQGATNNDVQADIAKGAGKVENVDGEANGVVMNPGDFWSQVAERRSTRPDGDMNGTAPFGAPPPTIWGLPVVRTRAMATLTGLVGDFARGALILDRQGITIRESDSHDTYFVLNKRAVLAEERVGLAIFRPDYFVKLTLDITA